MSNSREDLTRLAEEQAGLQFPADKLKKTIRSRTLSEYSSVFGMPNEWLKNHLTKLISSEERAVFVDLGCGDEVALTEALRLADILGRNNLRAIGVDVLPPDPKAIFFAYREYQPEFQIADIDTFEFPEAADIVTLSNVLFWTGDPLRALANAAAQTKVGGVICAEALVRINETSEQHKQEPLFQKRIAMHNGQFAGFQLLHKTNNWLDAVVLQKIEPLDTPEAVQEAWFGAVPQLQLRIPSCSNGFNYHYAFH